MDKSLINIQSLNLIEKNTYQQVNDGCNNSNFANLALHIPYLKNDSLLTTIPFNLFLIIFIPNVLKLTIVNKK